MSRRRYMNDSGEFSSINNLLSWENHRGWNNTLIDIVKKDDISTMKIKRLMPGVDALEKKVKVKPNTLYKLTFDYEVLTSYTMYGDLFGIIIFDGKSSWDARTYVRRDQHSLAYHTISTEPEKKSVVLYFLTKSDSIILHMPLTAINDDQTPTFTFGNFVLVEEPFPPIVKDDKLRPVRVLVSGDDSVLKVRLNSGENKDIPLTPGLNTITLPEEIRYLAFNTPVSKDNKSHPIVWADLGNVKVRDPQDLFKLCNKLLSCYGISISENPVGNGTSLYSTFYGCDILTYVDKMNIFMINHVTWVSFLCRKLKSIKLQNLGAKLTTLDLEPCAELDIDSITYMVDNSAVPDNSTCSVILAESLVNRIPSDLINRASRDKRVILKKRR